jgi:hypothetical protein
VVENTLKENNMIDWKRKLTSRKLWLAVAGFVTGLILAFNGSAQTAETVSGCIMSGASVIAYIVGEGLADFGAKNLDKNGDE